MSCATSHLRVFVSLTWNKKDFLLTVLMLISMPKDILAKKRDLDIFFLIRFFFYKSLPFFYVRLLLVINFVNNYTLSRVMQH